MFFYKLVYSCYIYKENLKNVAYCLSEFTENLK